MHTYYRSFLFFFFIFLCYHQDIDAAQPDFTIQINGVPFTVPDGDLQPYYLKSGRTMVPLRFISNQLGVKEENIHWDPATKLVVIQAANMLHLNIGSPYLGLNQHFIRIDAPAELTHQRTYLPLRAIVENLNGTIHWDSSARIVNIIINEQAFAKNRNTAPTPIPSKIYNRHLADSVPVLTYHHLLRDQENQLYRTNSAVTSVEMFEQHMKYLYENGFSTFTLQELEQYLDGKIHLPQKSVIITFDDGYLSNYHYGYTILKNYGFSATIFAVTSLIREQPERFHPDQLNYISWPEINQHSDVFSIECHTYDMHRQVNLKGYLLFKPNQEILADLALSKSKLNASYFAYPYGQYNQTTTKLLKESGYRMAFTTKNSKVTPKVQRFEMPRYGIYPWTKMNDFIHYVN
ncbi:stalk domain-containing protein [Ammoniphilus sp. YIM 78166]|uniref:stalk domain-containing protein n=1 Tax=Ammoniphilus sp. YIM 78166 TaxID=1644106 RepID=UPI00106F758B|nr:stalk domain-containing protein [Ammoniphilus sp. YIM 78166]